MNSELHREIAKRMLSCLYSLKNSGSIEEAEDVVYACESEIVDFASGETTYSSKEEILKEYLGLDYRYLWIFESGEY